MEQSIVFFDIDGTLLDHNKNLPQSTKDAIQQLKDNGHKVAIATGRAPFMFKGLCQELDIHSYVSMNGQYVVLDGVPIYKDPLDIEELEALTQFSSLNNHPMVYIDHEDMKSNVEFHHHIEESVRSLKITMTHPDFDPNFFKDREIYQALLFCASDEEDKYTRRFTDFGFIRWHEFSLDVLPRSGSKAIGIEKMIKKLNLTRDQVYAFGDGLNDIEMLHYAGNGIAMGNAHEKVKKAANFITKDVDDNGIVYGLELIGLV